MRTLNRAAILLALFIPFSLTIPIVEMIAPCPEPCHPELVSGSFSGIGVRGLTSLFSVQSVEAYTYQDVLDYLTTHPAPSNCIHFVEESLPNHYVIKERCNAHNVIARENIYYETLYRSVTETIPFGTGFHVHACDGLQTLIPYHGGQTVSYYVTSQAYNYRKMCDGTEWRIFWGATYQRVSIVPCYTYHVDYTTNCAANDVILAEFFPINECTDNDGDGYYAYDSASCPEGNNGVSNGVRLALLHYF